MLGHLRPGGGPMPPAREKFANELFSNRSLSVYDVDHD